MIYVPLATLRKTKAGFYVGQRVTCVDLYGRVEKGLIVGLGNPRSSRVVVQFKHASGTKSVDKLVHVENINPSPGN